jgi:vancomycin resistance protein YoaR
MTIYGRSRPMHHWVLIGTLVAVLLVAAGLAAILRPSPEVPRGTSVAGVPVGGFDDSELRAAIDGPVRERVRRAVLVRVASSEIKVQPDDLGIRLDTAATYDSVGITRMRLPRPGPRDLRPVLAVDLAAARSGLDGRLRGFRQAARNRAVRLAPPETLLDLKEDASWSASSDGVTLDPGKPGQGVDSAAGVDALTEAIRAGQTTVRLAVTTLAPGNDTPGYAGVDQLIGTFTTYHPCCAPRVTNIHRMAELIDGTAIAPGGTFSLNDASGERTRAKGFVAAPAIVDGELEDQVGGGVSQFSTTLFNAAWFAGLDVVKHQPHSLYIPRYPPGREATLDWRAIDQVIHNDTSAPAVIRVRTTATSITIGIYGHTGDRTVSSVTGSRVPRASGAGFSVEVRRTVRDNGADQSNQTLRWTYTGLD